jgi:hypothetical protein
MINKIQQTNRQSNLNPGVWENNYVRIQDLDKVINEVNAEILAIDTDINDGIFDSALVSDGGNIELHTDDAKVNTSATITGVALSTGYLTSTSIAPVTITLPTATDACAALGGDAGTSFEFIVNNSGGANTVTVAVNTGIVAATPVITGGGTLTVSVANGIGIFRIVFTSATTARLFRIG